MIPSSCRPSLPAAERASKEAGSGGSMARARAPTGERGGLGGGRKLEVRRPIRSSKSRGLRLALSLDEGRYVYMYFVCAPDP